MDRQAVQPIVRDASALAVLVIGAQGVLGSLAVRAFDGAGWRVRRGSRRADPHPDHVHVDLDEPESLAAAIGDTDVVVNTVPDEALVAERMVLSRGGLLINVSAMSHAAGERLRERFPTARGTVVMHAGVAPGVTNLVAAQLLAQHPEADEIELVFTVSMSNGAGRAGRAFAHRGLTTAAQHRTATFPLPAPFGTRRCVAFAEPDRGWLGEVAGERRIRPYVCLAEGPVHAALLALNRTRLMARLPKAAFVAFPGEAALDAPAEPVGHWVSVRRRGTRLAARTIECRGDYRAAAAATVVLAAGLLGGAGSRPSGGVFAPEDLLELRDVAEALAQAGITVSEPARRPSPTSPEAPPGPTCSEPAGR
jgi:hypothetical protein